MRTYKRKTECGKISKEIYEKAAAILEKDKTKKNRGIAKDLGLCHKSLTRYLKKRKEVKEKGTPIESGSQLATRRIDKFSTMNKRAF
ncbi:unnamed protein product [Parnassius apollo]|uniref:(apollo) hypothetical protein n=1 Tax=Parnassius apollo TaxID=110799 RepID=A0A8S3WIR0_PARAO|nr:unnamed protein product [Parnassius apollo]